MKKKTKSRLRNSLFVPFCIALAVCVSGVALNSLLFYKSFFRALTKMNEEPIATITFKYKTAQRKFLDRVVWDRLRQNSPVYNGDTLHTSSLSEATVWFSDGNVMELSENTMAQVFLSENSALRAELSDGAAYIDSSLANEGMTLSSNGIEVQLKKGSSMNAKSSAENSVSKKNLSLQVLSGSAELMNNPEKSESQAALLGEGDSLVFEQDGNFKKPVLKMVEPVQNAKILYHSGESKKVDFKWEAENSSAMLLIASDKNFKDVAYRFFSEKLNSAVFELKPGIWYWKLSSIKDDEESDVQTGKIQIIHSPLPELLVPVSEYEFNYRTKLPAVRLIWTESPYATSYRLEISSDPKMKNLVIDQRQNLTSAIISTLKEGQYWWRVTPFYTINRVGLASPSGPKTFSVRKKGRLAKPKTLVPINNGLVNTEISGKGISFSWKHEDDAEKYMLKVSSAPDFSSLKIKEQTSENYFSFDPKKINLEDGKYFWSVSYVDSEGNVSESSETSVFYAMKGSPEQHTIEPVDGYRVAQSLVPDTKFTWKRNLPENFETVFELSSEKDFSRLIYSDKTSSSSMRGINLKPGTYFWRLNSKSTTDDIKMVSSAKTFIVLDSLEAPELKNPGSKAVARESVPFRFSWNEVEDADFYKFSIYRAGKKVPVFEDNVYGTEVDVDMFNPKEFIDKTNYRWQVQAQSNAIPGLSSRRTGKLAERPFYLVKLRPVEVEFPKQNAQIKGSEAILNPVMATWSSVDKVRKAQFVLSRIDVNPPQVIIKIPSDEEFSQKKNPVAPRNVLLDTADGLRAGKYQIIVYAETLDGIDISNTDRKNRRTFDILPVELLEKAQNLVAKPAVFNREYLSVKENPKCITLSWSKVPKATDYFVEIKDKKGRALLVQNIKNGTSYKIDFTAISAEDKIAFSKGRFSWTVYGVRRIDTDNDGKVDKIFQEGIPAESVFETDIPSPKKSKAKGAANPYGK